MPKILVIDDSPFMRHQLRTYLEAAGHEVVEFLPLSALGVIAKVREVQPDLILSNYNMPDADELRVTRMAKRASSKLPVLILRDTEREWAWGQVVGEHQEILAESHEDEEAGGGSAPNWRFSWNFDAYRNDNLAGHRKSWPSA